MLDERKASLLHLPVQHTFPAGRLCELEKEHPDSIVILAAWVDRQPCFRVDHRILNTCEAVTVLVAEGPVLAEFRGILAAAEEKTQPLDTDIADVRGTGCG